MYLDKVLIFDNFLPKNYFKEIKKHGHSIHYIFSQNYDNDVDSPMITSSIHIDHPNISKKIKKSVKKFTFHEILTMFYPGVTINIFFI